MRLHELAAALHLAEFTPEMDDDPEITQGYVSDLISDILAHAPADGILVSAQTFPDIVEIARLARQNAIVFSCGRTPDAHLVAHAAADGLSLFGSQEDSFEVVGRMYQSGVRSGHRVQKESPPSQHGFHLRHRAEAGRGEAPPFSLQTGG